MSSPQAPIESIKKIAEGRKQEDKVVVPCEFYPGHKRYHKNEKGV